MEFKTVTLPNNKSIALVAHDNKKQDLVAWCSKHRETLKSHTLYATGTTGTVIANATQLPINKLISGPLGGDQQVGSLITEGKVDFLIFFWDPFEPMPHDPDVKALLRIAAVWNIPVACNQISADFMVASPLFNNEVDRSIPDYEAYMAKRAQ
ncbi:MULTISPECIES: methylglyoxal synthase [Marinimicrobium]|jgi:methylglyoxal synthase|uniref:Methylglyoxal synthase n=1 Tax=Marinimicrobium koreense TaxID=306545 RepID=A0A3N1NKD0_9GAMM|nr:MULTISPECIES: methylglyoxal synthase [Marinimicrobium]MAN53139.1 methylglyoxal synthase [Marinimicrobium sp.]ROQ20264.1 methylglyoxal synthase [Marinimicrobium koreense]|tara:strand:- start:71 stop:529 length:459 start_codon:yes stop_codon:yes gene_type:complete